MTIEKAAIKDALRAIDHAARLARRAVPAKDRDRARRDLARKLMRLRAPKAH